MSVEGAKPKAVEELVDFYFHRRLAIPVVRAAARMGLTPNQVTCLSLLAGLVSAGLFYRGLFPSAALALLAAIVLDCSDGMLARITGTSSPVGRILDGSLDAVWIVAIWFALYFGGRYSPPSELTLPFMAVSGACMPLHCWTYDGVKTSYVSLCEPDFSEKHLSSEEAAVRARASRKSGRYFEALLYAIMSYHHAVFVRPPQEGPKLDAKSCAAARKILAPSMRLWSFLGEGTHLALLFTAGLLTPFFPDAMLAACAVILIPMNLLWVAAAVLWFRGKKRLLADPAF